MLRRIWLAWGILNLGIIGGLSPRYYPFTYDDSSSYIEAARHFKEGKGLLTYIYGRKPIHTDLQPLESYPPGYPLMIYGLSLLGIDVAASAVLVPCLWYLVLPCLLFNVLRFLAGDVLAFFVTAVISLMASTIHYSLMALSDVPFLGITLLSFWLLFEGLRMSDSQKKLVFYGVWAGLTAGFALAVRNVGFAIPLSVAMGLTLGMLWGLLSPRVYGKIMLSYAIGFILGYGPFLVRNFIVFHTAQPYKAPPSELTVADNVRSYLLALISSFGGKADHLPVILGLTAAAVLLTGVMLLRGKYLGQLRLLRPTRIIAALVIFFYLVFGTIILILARTKYLWGEYINARHLLQYNWIFLAGISAIAMVWAQWLGCWLRINAKQCVLIAASLLLWPQVQLFSNNINYQARQLQRMRSLRGIPAYLSDSPEGTYFISTLGPRLRIHSGRPIRQLDRETFPEELAKAVCPQRPLLVILEQNYPHWQNVVRGEIPAGYELKAVQSNFIVLFHPRTPES